MSAAVVSIISETQVQMHVLRLKSCKDDIILTKYILEGTQILTPAKVLFNDSK